MIALALLLLGLWADAQVALLGSDDWHTREAAQRRLDHPLAALALPARSADPEVDRRLGELRRRNLRYLDPTRLERHVLRADPRAWVGLYLVPGRSAVAGEHEAFARLHADDPAARALFAAWPAAPGEGESFLLGGVLPGEYERYLAHLDYHRRVAPMPREVEP